MALAALALFPLDTSAAFRLDPRGTTAPSLPAAVFLRLTNLLQPKPGHPPAGTPSLCLLPHSGENS